MPLAMRIRQDGLPVYGFGTAKTPEASARPAPASSTSARSPRPTKAEAAAAGPRSGVDETVVKLLGDAIKAAKRDERGFASLSEVGKLRRQPLLLRRPQLRLFAASELIEAIPNFQVEKREGGAVYVKRVR